MDVPCDVPSLMVGKKDVGVGTFLAAGGGRGSHKRHEKNLRGIVTVQKWKA
jgi:hypothetical protein